MASTWQGRIGPFTTQSYYRAMSGIAPRGNCRELDQPGQIRTLDYQGLDTLEMPPIATT